LATQHILPHLRINQVNKKVNNILFKNNQVNTHTHKKKKEGEKGRMIPLTSFGLCRDALTQWRRNIDFEIVNTLQNAGMVQNIHDGNTSFLALYKEIINIPKKKEKKRKTLSSIRPRM
jgi:hypothetical protein